MEKDITIIIPRERQIEIMKFFLETSIPKIFKSKKINLIKN